MNSKEKILYLFRGPNTALLAKGRLPVNNAGNLSGDISDSKIFFPQKGMFSNIKEYNFEPMITLVGMDMKARWRFQIVNVGIGEGYQEHHFNGVSSLAENKIQTLMANNVHLRNENFMLRKRLGMIEGGDDMMEELQTQMKSFANIKKAGETFNPNMYDPFYANRSRYIPPMGGGVSE